MRLVRFQTDLRWWILCSAILFLGSSWVPIVSIEVYLQAYPVLLTPVSLVSIMVDLRGTNPDIPIDWLRI